MKNISILITLFLLSCTHHPHPDLESNEIIDPHPNGNLKSISILNPQNQLLNKTVYDEEGYLTFYGEYNNGLKNPTYKKIRVADTKYCFNQYTYDSLNVKSKLADIDPLQECVPKKEDSSITGYFIAKASDAVKEAIDPVEGKLASLKNDYLDNQYIHDAIISPYTQYSKPVSTGFKDGFLQVIQDYSDLGVSVSEIFKNGIPEIDTTGLGQKLKTLSSSVLVKAGDPYGYADERVQNFIDSWSNQIEEGFLKSNLSQPAKATYSYAYVSGFALTESILAGAALKTLKWGTGLKRWTERRKVSSYVEPKPKVTKISKVSSTKNKSIHPPRRLPENNGEWSGQRGASRFRSDRPAVLRVTKGKGIPFHKDQPIFTRWSEGSYSFKKGQLNGEGADFGLIHKRIAQDKGLKNAEAGRQWLKDRGLTAHHVDKRRIELVPSELHNNIPHIGGASELRNHMH